MGGAEVDPVLNLLLHISNCVIFVWEVIKIPEKKWFALPWRYALSPQVSDAPSWKRVACPDRFYFIFVLFLTWFIVLALM